ncbi:ran-binding protein [Pleomassaria siparia CBS 279.74]|uniref:Ran-binding protein n=1 Tax=Pleomassaria siparia CBS 279.74 TaxID=1314801 RepID=A0A6G1KL96_9PLEO|nr:ran-binding protein [Pleomassaria siparia CBS 279.74]
MFRRSSYASVAAGNSGQPPQTAPTRSGAFSHLVGSNPSSGAQANYPSTSHSRPHPRSVDIDGHNNMSTSWGRNGPLPSYTSQFGYLNGYGGGIPDGPLPSFFVPSYLRGSKHAEKLEEVHNARVAAHRDREYRSTHSSNTGSLSTSSSSVNLHKGAPSHRGLTHDIVERAPVYVEEPVVPWPTKWNDMDKYAQMEIDEGGRQAKYGGTPKPHDEAASVRADHPMPRQCGIYYYEITVVSKGKDGRMIGVGFCGPKVVLSRIPGWEPESYAYHGDDGQLFSNATTGKPYGPKFGTLDVIGCGINFRTGTAFFTKNGHYIGTAFKDIKNNQVYYPTVGMKRPGETLRANFGQEPFAFDIDKMVQAEKASIQAEIARAKSPHQDKIDETDFIQGFVRQYLTHDGYVDTARAFKEEVIEEVKALAADGDEEPSYVEAEEDLDAINRQKIRAAIVGGDIDKALKHTSAYYPSVLRDNENIYFKLRCRKFIEMIRRCSELTVQYRTTPSKRSTTSTSNNRNSTATDEYDFEMELDEQLGVHNNGASWGDGADLHADEDDDIEDKEAKLSQLMTETLEYGMELKSEFSNDPRREVKRALEDTFALIAYENVRESSLAPLLDTAGRTPVAEELNSAILVSLGKSSSAALERLVQQTEALVNELGDDGGPGAFINVRRDFLM